MAVKEASATVHLLSDGDEAGKEIRAALAAFLRECEEAAMRERERVRLVAEYAENERRVAVHGDILEILAPLCGNGYTDARRIMAFLIAGGIPHLRIVY